MRQILPFINVNGKMVDQKSACISISNAGFLYRHGIFTTIKVRAGCPLFFEHHLHRLEISATQLNIQLPSYILSLKSYIAKAVYATIKQNNLVDGGIRVTLTPATICIHAFITKCHSRSLLYHSRAGAASKKLVPLGCGNPYNNHVQKIPVITTPDTRDIYKTHKLTYRLPHLLAQKKAQSQGAEDTLFTQNNKIIESTSANIFSYVDKNTLITPPISGKGLDGITRQILIENLPILENPIPTDTTNPLILVNSLNLRIIESIDGRKINQNPEFINLIRQTLDKAEKSYIKKLKIENSLRILN